MQQIFFFIFAIFSLSLLSQPKKSTYKISSFMSPKGIIRNTAKLTVSFIGPTKQPVKSHVKMLVNNDTLVPKINTKGIYVTYLDTGIYKLKFFVPTWYDVAIDSLDCGENEDININVYFEAKEIKIY